jgi:hypothetical protein
MPRDSVAALPDVRGPTLATFANRAAGVDA